MPMDATIWNNTQRPDCLYNAVLGIKKEDIGHENAYPWNINSVFPRG